MAEVQEKPFRQVSPTEYEIKIGDQTRIIKAPFAVTEAVFKEFITSGGVIDPETGLVQQNIVQLITSFRNVGDLLLSEYDDEGHETKRGNCAALSASDVVVLFQLATHLVESFIQILAQLKEPQGQPKTEDTREKTNA
ncbi:hypothetical protein [Geobacter sp. SVR]|uniref:hypothetical protein n=1 Tax=Geobacter sp. SVR TaxID=2495594 RepID=UPI00143EFD8B|nr:hypothetical protein [Geobacter sp. SVR]BCS54037.1 hypothetical protein GSVR_23450 [Geobacter sp. SVR]GCF86182.1 hypothetical protein GSbR_27820 [Geobacter sp. SVR]